MSGLDLVVWNLEEDREERLIYMRHVIVGWFRGDVSKSVGGLFFHRQNIIGSHAFEIIGRIGLEGNMDAASFWNRLWNWKIRTRG